MTENIETPLNVEIINIGTKTNAFVPYGENARFPLESTGKISFEVKDSEIGLYYKKQATEDLLVNVGQLASESEIETGHYNPSTDDLDPGAPYICKDPAKSEFEIHPTYFVLGGLNYYPETPEIGMPAGNRFEIKLRHEGITSRDDLPSHGNSLLTITDGDGTAPRIRTFGRSAFQEDGSLIIVVNIKSKTASLDVMIHWTDDSEEDERLTFYFNDTKFGQPGEKFPNLFNVDIKLPQEVKLTNVGKETIKVVPFKQNFDSELNQEESMLITAEIAEEAMYYLMQSNDSIKVELIESGE